MTGEPEERLAPLLGAPSHAFIARRRADAAGDDGGGGGDDDIDAVGAWRLFPRGSEVPAVDARGLMQMQEVERRERESSWRAPGALLARS